MSSLTVRLDRIAKLGIVRTKVENRNDVHSDLVMVSRIGAIHPVRDAANFRGVTWIARAEPNRF